MRWICAVLLSMLALSTPLLADPEVPPNLSLERKLGKVNDCKDGYARITLLRNRYGDRRVGLFLKGRERDFVGYLDEERWKQLSAFLRQGAQELVQVGPADHRTLGEVRALKMETLGGSFFVELMGPQKAGLAAVVLRGRDTENSSAWLFFDQERIQELLSQLGAIDAYMNED